MVITKGVLPIFLADLSKENVYGITLVSLDEDYREEYEPNAAPLADRLAALKALHDKGCKDIRAGHQQIYSPLTCSFVTQSENTAEANMRISKRNHYRGRPIKCTNSNGTSIIYENIGEAKKAGYNLSSIRSCICGWRKTHKGCKFEYISNQ